jgi:hypothetical protein
MIFTTYILLLNDIFQNEKEIALRPHPNNKNNGRSINEGHAHN